MKELILEAWNNRELLKDAKYSDAVRAVMEELDKGRLRVANPPDPSAPIGNWQVNEWVKQAILMYFAIQQMQTWDLAPFEFYDKMLLKKKLCGTWCSCGAPCRSEIWCIFSKERCINAKLCKYRRLCR